jgi:hypothetical protein
MAITPVPPVRPAKDEWGVYDPQQAGLAALFARLDSGSAAAPKIDTARAKDNPAALERPAPNDPK